MDNLTSKAPRSDKPTTMTGYSESIVECFDGIPDVARPLIGNAERLLKKIEKMLVNDKNVHNLVASVAAKVEK